MSWTAAICRRALGISLAEATFSRRGFCTSRPDVQLQLEDAGQTFLRGYNLALQSPDLDALAEQLDGLAADLQGFGYEGAAMAVGLLDHLSPARETRFPQFVQGVGAPHVYMVHVGYGWAVARLFWLRRRLAQVLRRLDPLLGWLAIDGFGFHTGFFDWKRAIDQQRLPVRMRGYVLRAYDQGLGRSIWFVRAADPAAIGETIDTFPAPRRADLWSGIGLACAYAGGVPRGELEALRTCGAAYGPELAQGAAFAAKARMRAGNLTSATEMACEVLCGLSAAETARTTDDTLPRLQPNPETSQAALKDQEPAYESWRRAIRARFTRRGSFETSSVNAPIGMGAGVRER